MKFKELSQSDLNLIKDEAIRILAFERQENRVVAIGMSVLQCIRAKGYYLNQPDKDILKAFELKHTPCESFGFKINQSLKEASSDKLIEAMFFFFSTHGITITRDPSKKPTWSKLSRTLYDNTVTPKKPWMF